jgi:flavorubredoxin
MAAEKLIDNIYWVGTQDYSRRIFDELVPLHEGTSYNAYFIRGTDKTALVDTDDPKFTHELLGNLQSLNVKHLDYVIANHAEQDHSGSLPQILKAYPEAKVVTNEKCKSYLMDLLPLTEEHFLTIADRQTLPLGGITLEFILFPWAHWPETMLTFAREPKILFSCDLFGAHLADSRIIMEKEREAEILDPALRYFAEIMYPYRDIIARNFPKVLALAPAMIAPSHGPVHADPAYILKLYEEWISPRVKNKVAIPFVSMHGSTEAMVNYLTDRLMEKGIEVKPIQLSGADNGNLAMAVADAATVVVGSSTVLNGMHPLAAHAVYLYNLLKPKTKFVSIIGSYGWGSKMVEQIQAMLDNVKAEVIPPVVIKGFPKAADFAALDRLADQIADSHQKIGLR